MKVVIYSDERYPDYGFSTPEGWPGYRTVEVPNATIRKWKRVDKLYCECQDEMRAYEKQLAKSLPKPVDLPQPGAEGDLGGECIGGDGEGG